MAWNYYGDDAYFHGAIKLGYWKIWLVMGLIYNPGLYLIKNHEIILYGSLGE